MGTKQKFLILLGITIVASIAIYSKTTKPKVDIPKNLRLLESDESQLRKQAAHRLIKVPKESFPHLLVALSHDKWEVRQAAIYAFVYMGKYSAEAIPQLLKMLYDPQKPVRDTVIWALQSLSSSNTQALTKAMESQHWRIREDAFAWLSKQLPQKALITQTLCTLLKGSEHAIQRFALEKLGNKTLLHKRILPCLKDAYTSSSWSVRSQALALLGKLGTQSDLGTALLQKAVQDPNKWVQKTALEAIRQLKIHRPWTVPSLVQKLKGPFSGVQAAAMDALHTLGFPIIGELKKLLPTQSPLAQKRLQILLTELEWRQKKQTQTLETSLRSPKKQLHYFALDQIAFSAPNSSTLTPEIHKLLEQAKKKDKATYAWALGKIARPYSPKVVPLLLKELESSSWKRQTAAAISLSQLKVQPSQILSYLPKLLKNESPWVRRAIVELTGTLGQAAKHLTPKVLPLIKDSETWVRHAAAITLRQIQADTTEVVKALGYALNDNKWVIRHEAALSLKALGPKAKLAIPELKRALKNKHWLVRKISAQALGKMGESAIPALLTALKSKLWRSRYDGLVALGQIGSTKHNCLNEITRYLRDKNMWVRSAAAQAIGEYGSKAEYLIPKLYKLLLDRKMVVQYKTAIALGKIGSSATIAIPLLRTLSHAKSRKLRKAANQAINSILGK